MLNKTLLATVTAGLIAAGAMVGAAGTASAAGVYFGGPGFGVHIGPRGGYYGHRHRVCRPVFRTQSWVGPYGRVHYRQVIVGHRCYWGYGH